MDAKRNYRREVADKVKKAVFGVFHAEADAVNPYALVVEVPCEDGSTKKFRVIVKEL